MSMLSICSKEVTQQTRRLIFCDLLLVIAVIRVILMKRANVCIYSAQEFVNGGGDVGCILNINLNLSYC
jgi:hypothetical protein